MSFGVELAWCLSVLPCILEVPRSDPGGTMHLDISLGLKLKLSAWLMLRGLKLVNFK